MTIWNYMFLAVLLIIAVTLMIIGWEYESIIQEEARIVNGLDEEERLADMTSGGWFENWHEVNCM